MLIDKQRLTGRLKTAVRARQMRASFHGAGNDAGDAVALLAAAAPYVGCADAVS